MNILCSTGALIGRPNGRNIFLLKDLIKQLNCDGLEFMFYSDWYGKEDEVVEFLNSLEFPIPVMHCQKTVGEMVTEGRDKEAIENFTRNVNVASKIGARKMVIHLWNGIISDSNFDNQIKMYPQLREIARDKGVDLLVENVLCNQKSPMKRWVDLYEKYPDIHFIFDTKMAKFHEELNLIYEDEYRWLFDNDLIKHYHVNDYSGGYMDWGNLKVLPVGAGNINFKPFFKLIKEIGYDDTLTVEATAVRKDGSVDTDMLNKCFDDIRRYLK